MHWIRDSRSHLKFARESYFEHMRFTWWFCGKLLYIAWAVVMHGLIPACHKTTGSDGIFALSRFLLRRRRMDRRREKEALQLVDGAGV